MAFIKDSIKTASKDIKFILLYYFNLYKEGLWKNLRNSMLEVFSFDVDVKYLSINTYRLTINGSSTSEDLLFMGMNKVELVEFDFKLSLTLNKVV